MKVRRRKRVGEIKEIVEINWNNIRWCILFALLRLQQSVIFTALQLTISIHVKKGVKHQGLLVFLKQFGI